MIKMCEWKKMKQNEQNSGIDFTWRYAAIGEQLLVVSLRKFNLDLWTEMAKFALCLLRNRSMQARGQEERCYLPFIATFWRHKNTQYPKLISRFTHHLPSKSIKVYQTKHLGIVSGRQSDDTWWRWNQTNGETLICFRSKRHAMY